ncbi:hypothetical protein U1Q18_028325, partial [Sarracenia purpurea var. burkii]
EVAPSTSQKLRGAEEHGVQGQEGDQGSLGQRAAIGNLIVRDDADQPGDGHSANNPVGELVDNPEGEETVEDHA